MKVTVKGLGEVELGQRNFLSKGGEGSIYAKGGVAYKIYDPNVPPISYAKIQELSVLSLPNIIKPEKLIVDNMGTPVGYTMSLLKNTHPLVQLFTKSFKQRNGITTDSVIKLVRELQEIVSFVHNNGILIVDLNEMNFLSSSSFNDIYAIDVNSYQTHSFPATVLMPSVKDHHAKLFTESSDWFSWGIVAFQLFIGIHPYKGNHPDFDGIPQDTRMVARMKANTSVFNGKTKIPKVCEPLDSIPPTLRDWFRSVFEDGNRAQPPQEYNSVVYVVTRVKTKSGDAFDIKPLGTFNSDILGFCTSSGTNVVSTQSSIHVGNREYPFSHNNYSVVFTNIKNLPIAAYIVDDKLHIFDIINSRELNISSTCAALTISENRLYIQNGTDVVEVSFSEIGNNIIPSVKIVGKVLDLPEATKVYDGVIIQNLLGRYVASIFPKHSTCIQVSIPELDGYKVIEAKYENSVLVIIAYIGGVYDRFVLRLGGDYQYDIRKVENISYSGINMTVSDAGIAVLINEQEQVEAFSNRKDSGSVKIIEDGAIGSDMKLFHDGSKILFSHGNELFQLSSK